MSRANTKSLRQSPNDTAAKTARQRPRDNLSELRREYADDVQERIKAIACCLFAMRGVDGVTIRHILTAARVKNAGAIGYYFGSKEKLVRQILIDGTRAIDNRRGELLDAALATGRPLGVRDLVTILVHAVIDQPGIERRRFTGFALMVSMTHRDLYMTTMYEESAANLARCMATLKNLMPPMPSAARHQRFMFMRGNMAIALSRRESAIADGNGRPNDWAHEHTLNHYIQAETAMLGSPFEESSSWPSEELTPQPDVNVIDRELL